MPKCLTFVLIYNLLLLEIMCVKIVIRSIITNLTTLQKQKVSHSG